MSCINEAVSNPGWASMIGFSALSDCAWKENGLEGIGEFMRSTGRLHLLLAKDLK